VGLQSHLMRGTGRHADREARDGGGGEGGAGTGRRAYRRAEGVLGVLLHLGAFNIENAPRCILVLPYIYILLIKAVRVACHFLFCLISFPVLSSSLVWLKK
jgi:hypothetical protein